MERFRYRKVTPEMKSEMISLRRKGLSYSKIGEQLGVTESTVQYHTSERQRMKTLERSNNYNKKFTKEEIAEKNKERREYRSNWVKERYHQDDVFRKKMIRANNGGTFKE